MNDSNNTSEDNQDNDQNTSAEEVTNQDNVEAIKPEPTTEDLLEKSKNDYLYLRAEFENYKRQMIKERSDYLKFGSERLIVDLLNVLDNFKLALNVTDDSDNAFETFKKGMDLTSTEFTATLKRFGVNEVPSEGVPFDPTCHEALSSEETNEVPPGHISKVFKNSYKLHDRLIRPAQVIVAKEVSKAEQ